MSREFDYTIATVNNSRVLIDWVLNRAYDISNWATCDVERFKDGNLMQRIAMLSDLVQCSLDSWAVDCDPWGTF